MQNLNIEELKAAVAAKVAENMERLKHDVEVAKLQATLELESSEDLFQAKVRQRAIAEQTQYLQKLVDECAAIVASTPVFNNKTRANRVWAGSRKFNYGTQVDLMYQLATGILFSCAEHKQLLLAHTKLDLQLLEDIVEAFGTPTYYSRNYNTIVEAKPYDVERVKASINVMQSSLGVVVDTSALTESKFKEEFERSISTANNNYEQAIEAMKDADFEV